MKLIDAHVTHFRSVDDSQPFTVGQVTCFVGKNEAGKSALLLALATLNPHPLTPQKLEKGVTSENGQYRTLRRL